MKSLNHLKDIMAAAGYDFTSDNRSYHTRAINSVLSDGRIQLEVCEKGMVTRNADKTKKWNVVVKAAGFTTRAYYKNVDAFYILRTIGEHLQFPAVREKILAEVNLHKHCEKCNGVGHIPMFHYYCNGICFDCCGTGFSKYKDHVELNNCPVS